MTAGSQSLLRFQRAEAERNQLANPVPFEGRAVTACTDDLDIPPRQPRRLENRLPTAATGRTDHASIPACNGNPNDLVEPKLVLRSAECTLFGANPEPVAGVFHIGACHHLALDRLHCAAD